MFKFRVLLASITVVLHVYNIFAVYNDGWNVFKFIHSELTSMSWSGQFSADLLCFIILSGVWIAWRHKFSWKGIALGAFGGFQGLSFFAPYLLYLTFKCDGDIKTLFFGEQK